MMDEERKDKICELQHKNKKSQEFLDRMWYIQEYEFSVEVVSEEPFEYHVIVKNK